MSIQQGHRRGTRRRCSDYNDGDQQAANQRESLWLVKPNQYERALGTFSIFRHFKRIISFSFFLSRRCFTAGFN